MPASFNGVSLGLVFTMNTSPNPSGRQINAYPGANGLEVINHGSRGGRTAVSGAIVAAGALGLAAALQTFRALLADGGAYVLLDNKGTAFPGVILERFTPVGRAMPTVGLFAGANFTQRYEAEFLHLF
jgi:hypothetical protein